MSIYITSFYFNIYFQMFVVAVFQCNRFHAYIYYCFVNLLNYLFAALSRSLSPAFSWSFILKVLSKGWVTYCESVGLTTGMMGGACPRPRSGTGQVEPGEQKLHT